MLRSKSIIPDARQAAEPCDLPAYVHILVQTSSALLLANVQLATESDVNMLSNLLATLITMKAYHAKRAESLDLVVGHA